jgi:TrpR-related protein YerC/YecD
MPQHAFASATVQDFFRAVTRLKSPEECREFFADLCTTSEVLSFADRLAIAGLAQRGLPYRTISSITGASSATIARIVHSLKYGTGTLARVVDPGEVPGTVRIFHTLRSLLP